VQPVHVPGYIEELQATRKAPTVKQLSVVLIRVILTLVANRLDHFRRDRNEASAKQVPVQ
jgi:hypothetical protein